MHAANHVRDILQVLSRAAREQSGWRFGNPPRTIPSRETLGSIYAAFNEFRRLDADAAPKVRQCKAARGPAHSG
jgi:hypothetical protein